MDVQSGSPTCVASEPCVGPPAIMRVMDTSTLAAVVFAVGSVGVIAFQSALALGAPWGAYAMGGAFPGVYPPRLRVAAIVQGAVIGVFASVVLSASGVVLPALHASYPWLVWVVVAFSGLGVVLNAISRSAGERRIWVPVTLVMLASSLLVALDAG